MHCSISGPARSAIGTSKSRSSACSLVIRSLRVGPAVFGRQGETEEGLVEVNVTLDQCRKEQLPAAVDQAGQAGVRAAGGNKGMDGRAFQHDIDGCRAQRPHVAYDLPVGFQIPAVEGGCAPRSSGDLVDARRFGAAVPGVIAKRSRVRM